MPGKVRLKRIGAFGDLSDLSRVPALPDGEIHVWHASLEQRPARFRQLVQTLSLDERERTDRFYFERDRRRFVAGRGVLRAILGCYLGIEASHVQFCYGPHGKPYLAEGFRDGTLQFNLARSQELALFAFARRREIGVDLEYVRALPDLQQIAARFFSPRENEMLGALPAGQKLEGFLNCWTRKEAYVKAVGKGLVQPLDQFTVSLAPGEPARLLHVAGNPAERDRWAMWSLAPAPDYVGAVATARQGPP